MFVYLHSILFIYLYREKIFVAIKVVKSAGQYTETAHDEITLLMRVCMPFGISLNSLDNADTFLFSFCKKKKKNQVRKADPDHNQEIVQMYDSFQIIGINGSRKF